jgi:hypothetical protein
LGVTEHVSTESKWVLRVIGWSVALLVIFTRMYKVTYRKQVEGKVNCLDKASLAERTTSPLASVDAYAACIAGKSADAPALPLRCRYAGVWSSTRGNAVYQVTLEAGGRFVAEPAENTRPDAESISGAWSVAGRAMVWVYDSGAVWPPDINPITAESDGTFTLREVDGATTRYALIQRATSPLCKK